MLTLADLRIEYRTRPQGLAVRVPRFSWKLVSDQNDTLQASYRLTVTGPGGIVWDSGMQNSDVSVLVPYAGVPLAEETAYTVALTVTDNHGETASTETGFTTGVFDPTHFTAKMISHDFPESETACPVFVRRFAPAGTVTAARLYATAHGIYEAELNGKRIGDAYLAPGWTNYHKFLQVQYYDVTDLVQSGANELTLTVADGWYKGPLTWDCNTNYYGSRTAVWAELRLVYADGRREVIATDTDGSWSVRTGPVQYSQLYMGETIDTTAPAPRTAAVCVVGPDEFDPAVLTAQVSEPVRITERLEPIVIFADASGRTIVDFGQNISGFVELHVQGRPGQTVTLRHAEVLDKDGNFYPDTLRRAKSEDTYILNGEAQILRPHFTCHGFRYAAVEGLGGPEDLRPEMFTACVMHSDMRQIGFFHCSNEKVNRLQQNISWSLRDNFVDIPTDCPQRDERLGWMGDAQVFSWTAAFNRETALFFEKWMRDVAAASSLEQGVPHLVPDIQGTFSSAAWSDAAVIIPWVVWRSYGDKRILEQNWTCMHEWVDYITAHTNENGLWMTNYQYGDWLALDRERGDGSVGATDIYLVANAYYIYVTGLVAETAKVLGKDAEAEQYTALRDKTIASFRQEYYTPRGRIVSETQTGCVLSLHFGLANEKDRPGIVKALTTNIENHKNHLTTGFVGTPYLCHVLSDNGAHETAAMLFMREDLPSWLYAVNKGATTIWEKWDAILPDGTMQDPGLNSMNHYANGAIGDWMYRKIGGINETEAGYRRFVLRPRFVRGIEEAETALDSPYGRIACHWVCRGGVIRVTVTVPANTRAVLYLPEKPESEALSLGSGCYTYEYPTTTDLRPQRFTLDSTLGDIMAEPEGLRLLQQYAPELANNPMIEYAKRMTLAEGISSAPQIRPLYEAILQALNAAPSAKGDTL